MVMALPPATHSNLPVAIAFVVIENETVEDIDRGLCTVCGSVKANGSKVECLVLRVQSIQTVKAAPHGQTSLADVATSSEAVQCACTIIREDRCIAC